MRFALLAALALLTTPVSAHDYKIGDLSVDHPFAYETAKTAMAGGGYMEITNTGDVADRLIAVEGDYPRVEIHTMEMDGDVAKMVHLPDGLEIGPGETVSLAPGGFHVMFMGLNGRPFVDGDTIPVTLVFENAGRLEIEFSVEPRAAEGGMDHSKHNMNN